MPNKLFAFISCSNSASDQVVVETIIELLRGGESDIVPIIVERNAPLGELKNAILQNLEKCDFGLAIATFGITGNVGFR